MPLLRDWSTLVVPRSRDVISPKGDVEYPFWCRFSIPWAEFSQRWRRPSPLVLAGPAASTGNPEIAALQVGPALAGSGELSTSTWCWDVGCRSPVPAQGRASGERRSRPEDASCLGHYGRRAPLGRRTLVVGARLGRGSAAVRAGVARLSVRPSRRSPRSPNGGGSAALPGVGRAQVRRLGGGLDLRGARAPVPRSPLAPQAPLRLRPETSSAPGLAVSQWPRLQRPVRYARVRRRVRSRRVRGPTQQRLGEPRRGQARLRSSDALRTSLVDVNSESMSRPGTTGSRRRIGTSRPAPASRGARSGRGR